MYGSFTRYVYFRYGTIYIRTKFWELNIQNISNLTLHQFGRMARICTDRMCVHACVCVCVCVYMYRSDVLHASVCMCVCVCVCVCVCQKGERSEMSVGM